MGNLAETLLLFVPRNAFVEALYHSLGGAALSAQDALVMVDHYRDPEDGADSFNCELAELLTRLDRHYDDRLREMWGPDPGEQGEAVLASIKEASGRVREFVALIGSEPEETQEDRVVFREINLPDLHW